MTNAQQLLGDREWGKKMGGGSDVFRVGSGSEVMTVQSAGTRIKMSAGTGSNVKLASAPCKYETCGGPQGS